MSMGACSGIFRYDQHDNKPPWPIDNTIRRFFKPFVIFLLLVFFQANAIAQTLVVGYVRDATTSSPVIGGSVLLKSQGDEIGSASTNDSGKFTIPLGHSIEGRLDDVVLEITHDSYASHSDIIKFVSGSPAKSVYNFSVLPNALASCINAHPHAVIVGHFRPPPETNYAGVPGRIAEALQFSLLIGLQEQNLSPELQPIFWECHEAQPRSVILGKEIAKALRADAFLSGNLKVVQSGVDISIYVADAYDLYGVPQVVNSRAVDLSLPAETSLNDRTLVLVFGALAAGLKSAGDCENSIYVLNAAERISGQLEEKLMGLRRACESLLPHNGLLSQGGSSQ